MLEINGLKKQFGAVSAVDDLDLQVTEGGIYGIIGPNGSGKTTLFDVISGVLTTSIGSVRYQGVELLGLPGHRIARLGIARTFQNLRNFHNLTVLENVLGAQSISPDVGILQLILPHFKRERRRRAEALEILDRVGLVDQHGMLARALPLGAQRRLELARALARVPTLLLLDEPAGGMVPNETEAMGELIEEIAKDGPTVLLIEHKVGLVMALCRHIAVLNFGRKIAEGRPDDIQKNSAAMESYLGTGAGRA